MKSPTNRIGKGKPTILSCLNTKTIYKVECLYFCINWRPIGMVNKLSKSIEVIFQKVINCFPIKLWVSSIQEFRTLLSNQKYISRTLNCKYNQIIRIRTICHIIITYNRICYLHVIARHTYFILCWVQRIRNLISFPEWRRQTCVINIRLNLDRIMICIASYKSNFYLILRKHNHSITNFIESYFGKQSWFNQWIVTTFFTVSDLNLNLVCIQEASSSVNRIFMAYVERSEWDIIFLVQTSGLY